MNRLLQKYFEDRNRGLRSEVRREQAGQVRLGRTYREWVLHVWDLNGPIVRITTPHIPLPAADHLEDLALPNAARIVEKIVRVMNG